MTEIERIKNKGILPDSFFRKEIRNDFLVTEERKKIWAIQLDLFFEFQKICNKHGLKYFLFFGSLLGAVRHNGFIPWDDDFDVAMPRSDYELLKKNFKEFEAPYSLESLELNENCYFTWMTLRNSRTAWVSKKLCYNGHNQGMFIDIFPIDSVLPGKEAENYYTQIKKHSIDLGTYMRRDNPYLDDNDKSRVAGLKEFDPRKTWNIIQNLAQQYNYRQTEYCWSASITTYTYEKSIFLKNDLFDVEMHQFENIEVPIPKAYKKILETIYGDYMQFPPATERTGHTGSIIDCERSYNDVVRNIIANYEQKRNATLWMNGGGVKYNVLIIPPQVRLNKSFCAA